MSVAGREEKKDTIYYIFLCNMVLNVWFSNVIWIYFIKSMLACWKINWRTNQNGNEYHAKCVHYNYILFKFKYNIFIKPTTHMHTYVHIGGTSNIWCRKYVVNHINTGNLPRNFPHRIRYKNRIPMEIKQTWCFNLSDILWRQKHGWNHAVISIYSKTASQQPCLFKKN